MFRIHDFLDFCRIWHLGAFGSMGNTPTEYASDLSTIMFLFNDPTSRSVNNSSAAGFGRKLYLYNKNIPTKVPPRHVCRTREREKAFDRQQTIHVCIRNEKCNNMCFDTASSKVAKANIGRAVQVYNDMG